MASFMNKALTYLGLKDIDDDELYDAILVCALFQLYNAWVDANGVADMSDQAYAATAIRLARDGYVAPQDSKPSAKGGT